MNAIATIAWDVNLSSACFSADGATVVVTSASGCRRYSAETGRLLQELSPDDEDYQTSSSWTRRQLDAMDIASEEERAACEHFRGFADYAATSPDGRFVAVGSSSGYLQIFDFDDDIPMLLKGHSTSMNNHLHQNSIRAMLFDCSSTMLISLAEEDDSPLLWDLSGPTKDGSWKGGAARLMDQPLRLNEVTPAGIDTISFSPVAQAFISTHRVEKTAIIWSIERIG